MVNVFALLVQPAVHAAMKLVGLTPLKVEIKAGTVMNIWVPRQIISNKSKKTRKNKPSIILIHGFLADGALTWLFQVLALTNKYDVYVPDLLFFGGSITDSSDRTTSFQAEFLAKGLRKLGVEKCTVVGLSYGGMVGFKLAKLHPRLVDSMIVTGTVLELTESISKARLEAIGFSSWSDFLMAETVEELKTLLSIGSHNQIVTRFPYFFYKNFLEVMFDNRKERAELLKALVVPDDELTIPKYSQKIYLLWAADDKIFDMEVAHNLQMQLGDEATFQSIKDAGHIVPLERPNAFNHCLKRILASLHDLEC